MNTKEKIKVLFFMPSFNIGGAEKVTLNLLLSFLHGDSRVLPYLVVCRNEGSLREMIPENLIIHDLGNCAVKRSWIRLFKVLYSDTPDILFSVMDGTNLSAIIAVMIAKLFKRYPKLICVSHITLSKEKLPYYKKLILNKMIKLLYPFADSLIAISDDIREDHIKHLPVIGKKYKTVYNAAFDDSLFVKAKESVDHIWFKQRESPIIVACGRFVYQKGFKVLIDAAKIIIKTTPAKFVIIGNGPLHNELVIEIKEKNLQNNFWLPGMEKNPLKFMAKADLFVHTSLWDGLPTVLIEAMACGVPVIATDCPSGPREIISDNVDGRLISPSGDPDVLAKAIVELLNDKIKCSFFVQRGMEKVKKFHVDSIKHEYEELFVSLVQTKNIKGNN